MLKDATGPGASQPHGLKEPYTPGMRVGGAVYILKRVLGRGTTGVVWLARSIKLERDVALKIFPDSFTADLNAAERLRTQVSKLSSLSHPNIVATHSLVNDYRMTGLSMEYVEGWSLAAVRVDKPGKKFSLEEITPWVRQICAGLQHAHGAGVVHGDLRPSHLLLDSHEQIKIASFLISNALRGIAGLAAPGISSEGLGCISPQQALGEIPSVQDDIYALGATIFSLLTGTAPFYKGQILAQICDLPAQSINARLAELGSEDNVPLVVEDAVARCLAKKPEERPQTVAAVLALLERSEISAGPTKTQTVKAVPANAPANGASPGEEPGEPERVAAFSAITAPQDAPFETPPVQPADKTKVRMAGALVLALCALCFFGWMFVHYHKSPALPSGSVDASFHPPAPDVEARAVAVQADKKILLGGRFTRLGEDTIRGIARLNPDGTLDATFKPFVAGDIHAIAVQADGKILIGGEFSRVNDKVRHRLARLNPDGTVDEGFHGKLAINREVRCILLQPDGKILLGGNFDRVANSRAGRITRLNADGTVDTSFRPGSGASAVVWGIALQPDGRIIVGGKFEQFDGQPCGHIVRLEPDGAIDQNFATGSGANQEVFGVTVQKDGRIVVGGEFYSFNEVECNRITRLNRDGSIDSTFKPGAGPNTGIRCVTLDGSGKILIGGIFTSVGGVARNRIARLNQNGSLDLALDPGEGANEVVRWIALQPDGRILLAGGFKQFGGSEDTCVARLSGDALLVSK